MSSKKYRRKKLGKLAEDIKDIKQRYKTMIKKLTVAVLVVIFSVIGCAASYAGTRAQANGIWKYKNDSGTYSANTWQWIDGQWTVNGVVQIQNTPGKAASSTNDRMYYINKWSGLPGESADVVRTKMLTAVNVDSNLFTNYTDTRYPTQKTYEDISVFLPQSTGRT